MVNERPALRVVEELKVNNLRDVATSLRRLADDVDAGKTQARRVLCVVETQEGIELYQWGDVDILGDVGLLEAAKIELASMVRKA